MNLVFKLCFIGFFLLFNVLNSSGQKTGTAVLDSLLKIEKFDEAATELEKHKSELFKSNNIDSLADYIYYHGKIKSKLENLNKATLSTKFFATQLTELTENKKTEKQILIELSTYYESIGDINSSLDCNIQALELALALPNETGSELGLIESNIGVYYKRLGDLGNAIIHHRRARAYYYSDENSTHESKYITNNSLGGMMWYSSKLDSAQYYYDLAYEEIIQADSSARNNFYRPAILKNNLAGVYSMNGNLEKSMKAMESAIYLMKSYLNSDIPDAKRQDASMFYFQLIDNLGGAFKDLGDYQKAKKLIAYAYEQKKKSFDDSSPEIFKGEILMGQIELALRNYPEAETHLLEGIRRLNESNSPSLFWRADAHHYLGSLYEQINNNTKAAQYYELAETYFEEALQGSYDEIYLNFVIFAAPFYANMGNSEKALELAHKALDYLENTAGSESLLTYAQRINIGEVNYILGNYDEAINYSNSALASLNDPKNELGSVLDSISVDFTKPLAISLREKAKLKKNPNPTTAELKGTFKELDGIVKILERRKSIFIDDEAVGVLIADYDDTFEFLKKVSAQLYAETHENQYLDKVINLNESALYSRLRRQLIDQGKIEYSGVPKEIQTEESELRKALSNWEDESGNVSDFFNAEKEWMEFLDKLKEDYPKYYKLKHASLEMPLDNIQSSIPEGTSVVRYLFINENLYCLVLDGETKEFIALNSDSLSVNVEKLSRENLSLEETSKALYDLYQSIWKPLEKFVLNQNVVILPEGNLFNLSFESLITEEISRYEELVSKSLLAKYFISYNYSLFLLSDNSSASFGLGNLAAFAPGFDDNMKKAYSNGLLDSLTFDFSYLELLPQPFALDLAQVSVKKFGGNAYVQLNSTAQNFINYAGGNSIIFIGTHAESNNLNPQLSKFIFAKEAKNESNEIYNYQIYNTNLTSDLAILTACETGKPSYQPGEGMVSMAHAFNFAGSKSILTSLWKIDERASVKIVQLFYDNLEKGLAKDEALQRAKLAYLNTEKGRTLDPKYWSGLVLIGNVSPIVMKETGTNWWSVALFGGLLLCLFLVGKRFQSRNESAN